jgi:catalase-peroxidase
LLSGNEQLRSGLENSKDGPIVYTGNYIVEKVAPADVENISVPFVGRRVDAIQEWTEVKWFKHLEPFADGFRNYAPKGPESGSKSDAGCKDSPAILHYSRVTGSGWWLVPDGSCKLLQLEGGVLTERVGALTNDFFINLQSNENSWRAHSEVADLFNPANQASGTAQFIGSGLNCYFDFTAYYGHSRRFTTAKKQGNSSNFLLLLLQVAKP